MRARPSIDERIAKAMKLLDPPPPVLFTTSFVDEFGRAIYQSHPDADPLLVGAMVAALGWQPLGPDDWLAPAEWGSISEHLKPR